ncbi:MAG TPA: hypothetical protein VN699_05675, partial [Pirellulales bacterium]|nr:hypothetical protein [Pirellulales bacterium]
MVILFRQKRIPKSRRIDRCGSGAALLLAAGLCGVGIFAPSSTLGQEPAASALTVPVATNGASLSFINDVLPLLTKHGCNSGTCHGRGSGQNGFKLSLFGFDPAADYAALADEGLGRRISWTAPDESLMLVKAAGQVPHGGGARFGVESVAYCLLHAWIEQGTPWGDEQTPGLVGIDVQPAECLLAAGESRQLQITAKYSDGAARDVTETAEYFSQQPVLFEVKPNGMVRSLGGQGEAAVMVRYSGVVAAARLTVPYRQAVADAAYAGFEPKNFVDRLAVEKWRKLRLAPSPGASD